MQFSALGHVAVASPIAGVSGRITWAHCEPAWKHVVRQIQQRTNKLRKRVRRGALNETATYENRGDDLAAIASTGLPVRSSHGNAALQPAPYGAEPSPIAIEQLAWYRYSANSITGHCPPGCVPAYIEFTIGAPGGLRILYDYMNDGYLITDHYVTYYEIAAPVLL
jgi:hypothetical protein